MKLYFKTGGIMKYLIALLIFIFGCLNSVQVHASQWTTSNYSFTGINMTLNATKTSIHNFTSANWTFTGGHWTMGATGPLVHVTGNTSTATATNTEAIVVGTTYKITIIGTGGGGVAYYTLGSVSGSTIPASGAIAITDYITALTTGSLIITPASACTVSITSITIEKFSNATGDLTVQGDIFANSGRHLDGTIAWTIGQISTSFGYNAGLANAVTSGAFFGRDAGRRVTSGTANTALGDSTLMLCTTGEYNVAVGQGALSQVTGGRNVGVGYHTLSDLTSNGNNTAIGDSSQGCAVSGAYNTSVGGNSLNRNQTGNFNTVIGHSAGYGVTSNSFSNNLLAGYMAGYVLTTGSNNIILGYKAGDNLTSGSNNIIIAYNTDFESATGNNQLNIGGIIKGTVETNVELQRTTLKSSAITCVANVCTDVPASPSLDITTDATAGADVLTVADGIAGEIRIINLKTDGGTDLEITPTNFANGTKITLGSAGQSAMIRFDGTKWHVLVTYAGVVS